MTVVIESLRVIRGSRIPAVLIALVTCMACVALNFTTGATAAAGADLQNRLEAAGSRHLTIVDVSEEQLMRPPVVEQVAGLGPVESVVGLSLPTDMWNVGRGRDSQPVPTWVVTGSTRDLVMLLDGRWALPGEAMVSTAARQTLGLSDGLGAVTDGSEQLPVVGTVAMRVPFDRYANGVFVEGSDRAPVRTLHVLTRRASEAASVQAVTLDILRAPPGGIQVESPADLAALQADVVNDFQGYGRQMLAGLLGGTAALVGIVVAADVMLHRRDLGRRRVLGATRGFVVALVTMSTVIPAAIGAVAAIGVAAFWDLAGGGTAAPWAFRGALAVLCVALCACASLLPAWLAAVRDPLRVLRTP